ncbi:MAG TPA: DUF1800 domain-containing protein [Gemmatimonadales bacterium]|nr:DUF1800 domain-containing protein [Gemmatimonadales bacterium]
MRKLLSPLLVALAACAHHGPADLAPLSLPPDSVVLPVADSAAAVHLLERFAFGARPGDIAHVEAVGIRGWLEEQLNPSRLDDAAGDSALRQYRLALRDPADLYADYAPGPPAARADSAARRHQMEGERRLAGAVMMSALARHIASRRQLLEVMTDFWTNHFNVFMAKGADRWLTADFVEHAIRPHALGRFEDLLVATATHPAMLVYLDNAQSVAPGSHPPGRPALAVMPRRGFAPMFPPLPAPPRAEAGLNENYARELMELHTLGVDGGYTQEDVIGVARILTGWGVAQPRRMGVGRYAFEFHAWAHDAGSKTVLGVEFPSGHGMDEGRKLLHLLAEHPATARHLSHQLCARFVADAPPDGCVDAAVAAWRRTGGDIRAVLVAIAASPDFWAPENRAAKFKAPLAFVASAVRALDGAPDTTARLVGALQQLGEPLFMHLTPDGYQDAAADWLNSGAILTRMNLALALASGRMPGVTVDLDRLAPVTSDYDALVRNVNAAVLGGQGSEHTLQVIRQQIGDLPNAVNARAMAVGLALGSPDFQRE